MIRAGVLSAEDHFHRDVRRHAADAGVRVELVLRSANELRTSGGLDVVIVHRPSGEDLESVQEVVGSLPIVVAGPGAFHSDTLRAQDGWAMVPDDDPSGVVAAARAAALGLSVVAAGDGGDEADDSDDGADAIHDLTSREQEVLRLVGGGATNHEVAAQLAISDNTVKYHLGSLYSKLGVSRRSEVIFEAIRRGLITV